MFLVCIWVRADHFVLDNQLGAYPWEDLILPAQQSLIACGSLSSVGWGKVPLLHASMSLGGVLRPCLVSHVIAGVVGLASLSFLGNSLTAAPGPLDLSIFPLCLLLWCSLSPRLRTFPAVCFWPFCQELVAVLCEPLCVLCGVLLMCCGFVAVAPWYVT